MRLIIIFLVTACVVAFFPGCSGKAGRVAAEINGSTILTSDVAKAIPQEKHKFDDVAINTPQALRELARSTLDMLIQEALLLDEAKRHRIEVTQKELDEELSLHFDSISKSEIKDKLRKHGIDPEFWFRSQRNKLIIRKLINQEVIEKIPVTEDEIQRYYKEHSSDFRLPMQYRARQILVETRDRAEEIAKRLDAGDDFAELAKKHSMSPDAVRGGDLGFFSTKDFPKVFSEICASLKPGERSKVKETNYGFQIFQLLDKRPPRQQPLDEVRARIIDQIRDERSAEYFVKWFDEIQKRSHIAIYDDALEEVLVYAKKSEKK